MPQPSTSQRRGSENSTEKGLLSALDPKTLAKLQRCFFYRKGQLSNAVTCAWRLFIRPDVAQDLKVGRILKGWPCNSPKSLALPGVLNFQVSRSEFSGFLLLRERFVHCANAFDQSNAMIKGIGAVLQSNTTEKVIFVPSQPQSAGLKSSRNIFLAPKGGQQNRSPRNILLPCPNPQAGRDIPQ